MFAGGAIGGGNTLCFVGGKAGMVKAVEAVEGGLADPAISKEVFEHMVAEQQHELAAVEGRDRFKAAVGGPNSTAWPHVSNDNPFSEAHFKTLKYCPGFADRFGSIVDSRGFCRDCFHWYSHEYRHGGIGLMTLAMVHHGKVDAVTQVRKVVLSEAFNAHPERFVRGKPQPPAVPEAAWINKPKTDSSGSETCPLLENDSKTEALAYGRLEDRRSWGILEVNLLDRTSQVPQNDTKFESEVSQDH